jgi:hypothetical protein
MLYFPVIWFSIQIMQSQGESRGLQPGTFMEGLGKPTRISDKIASVQPENLTEHLPDAREKCYGNGRTASALCLNAPTLPAVN